MDPMALRESKKGLLLIGQEVRDLFRTMTQQGFDGSGRAVAQSHPDDLRREAQKETALAEIRVLCDHREAILGGISPNLSIIG